MEENKNNVSETVDENSSLENKATVDNATSENAQGDKTSVDVEKYVNMGKDAFNKIKDDKNVKEAKNKFDDLKKDKKKFGIVCGAAAAVLLLIIILIATAKPTIDLNKFATVEFKGYNTVGTATLKLDRDGLKKKYGDKIKLKNINDTEYALLLGFGSTSSDILMSAADAKLDNKKNLKNGDKVVLTWSGNKKSLEKAFGVKLKLNDKKFTVKDLKEVGKFDPFDGLAVEFSGLDGQGTATVNKTNASEKSHAKDISYSFSESTKLTNGGKVTVKISNTEDLDYYISKFGEIPTVTEKEFTVSGLSGYLTSANDINKDDLEKIKKQSEDVFKAQYANKNECSVNKLTYLGNYFLSSKDDKKHSFMNSLYVVYKLEVAVNDPNYEVNETVVTYSAVQFKDVMISSDKKLTSDFTKATAITNSFNKSLDVKKADANVKSRSYSLYGFEDVDKMYAKLVTSNLTYFNSENNVKQ